MLFRFNHHLFFFILKVTPNILENQNTIMFSKIISPFESFLCLPPTPFSYLKSFSADYEPAKICLKIWKPILLRSLISISPFYCLICPPAQLLLSLFDGVTLKRLSREVSALSLCFFRKSSWDFATMLYYRRIPFN